MTSHGGTRLSYPQREALRKLADRPNDFYRAASATVLDALERRGLIETKYEPITLYTLGRITEAGKQALNGY